MAIYKLKVGIDTRTKKSIITRQWGTVKIESDCQSPFSEPVKNELKQQYQLLFKTATVLNVYILDCVTIN